MKKDINYKTVDGRGEHESFRDCVTKAIEEIEPGEGIHVIKDFEPFPMYKMMEAKGFDKHVEKVSDIEYHVYFYPAEVLKSIKMGEYLTIDNQKIKKILDIKVDFLKDKISLKEAKEKMNASFNQVTSQEFAVCEQYLQQYGITDDILEERMEELLEIFKDVLVTSEIDLPLGHPIRTYLEETKAIKTLLQKMEDLLSRKFIKNQWLEIYEKLSQITIHFSRKQNQLFAALERKGFDKPSKVMWTLDNNIKNIIKEAFTYLNEDQDDTFIKLQTEVINMIKDMMVKEVEILFPTAIEMLSEEEFVEMRKGDDEIGYCLIEKPLLYGKSAKEKAASSDVLDVSQGKLTLEQINLIFKHLPVDLSYVDEDELVKFYSDTKHRVFPRSAGVIGREVQNCHPRESVHLVEEIIRAFRAGEQDEAEFWLEMNGKFIYIIYNAVRDEKGNFRGVLEMMQDATHIRSLEGSQRLLSWENKKLQDSQATDEQEESNPYGLKKETTVSDLIKNYPFIKEYLLGLSPKFNKLKNPILFKTMSSLATLEMISERGGLDVKDLISKLIIAIEEKNKK